MKIHKTLNSEKGFTLLESIIVTMLALLAVSGILTSWHLMESKDRSLENYWRYKETLELAFQVTHHTLRSTAQFSSLAIINGGQGISFIGTDGLSRSFSREGNHYKFIQNGVEEVLIEDICDHAAFVLNGNNVDLVLEVGVPPNWKGKDDLDIEGTVYIRNR
jgi:competence protein ComGC